MVKQIEKDSKKKVKTQTMLSSIAEHTINKTIRKQTSINKISKSNSTYLHNCRKTNFVGKRFMGIPVRLDAKPIGKTSYFSFRSKIH